MNERSKIGVKTDDLGFGMPQNKFDLRPSQAYVDGIEYRSSLDDSIVSLEKLMGVIAKKRDHITFVDAQVLERAGQPVRSFAELFVGELLLSIDHAYLVRIEVHGPAAKIHRR
jgi:hypothetical protein